MPSTSRMTLLATCTSMLLAAAPSSDRSTPAAAVTSFYTWYVKAQTNNPEGTKPYLTASLYADYVYVVGAERCTKSAILDYDPFNGSQLQTTKFAIGQVVAHGDTATVSVTLGLWKAQPSRMSVHVVRSANGWHISDFVDSRGNGFANDLKANRSEIAHYARLTPPERTCLKALQK